MALFNIAYKNISQNLKNYFIYIFSMMFSVVIFFIFKSIQYNTQIKQFLAGSKKISSSFNAAATVIALFAAMFIWYSNSFFIKKRKKEIGLYSLLGIEKKQIGTLLFYETLVTGAIALILGIVIGVFLSKLFIQLLVNIIGLSVAVKFSLSSKAIYSTIQTFIILFTLISIHGYTIIYRFELIDLFKAESKSEKVPKVSFIKAVIAVVLIGSGYLKYLSLKNGGDFQVAVLFTFVTVVIGTYLLFDSLLLFIIKSSKNNKKKYFCGLNMISTSQLLYRINKNSKTLATIAILSAATLTAVGVSTSFMQDFNNKFDKENKFSYITNVEDKETQNNIRETINKYPNNKLKSEAIVGTVELKFMVDGREQDIKVIKESTLKEVIKAKGVKDDFPKLNKDDEIIYFYEFYNPKNKQATRMNNVSFQEDGQAEKLKIVDFRGDTVLNGKMLIDTVVVKDKVYEKYESLGKKENFKCYIVENPKKSLELTKDLEKVVSKDLKESTDKNRKFLNSYYRNYMEQSTGTGVLMFIGTFLGLVFLACTGSIMFFKKISEAEEEKYRYKILRNIGSSEEEIKGSIYKQVLFVFASPLIVGCIHSLVAVYLIADSFNISMLNLFLMSYVPYVFIYGMYYVLTSNYYYKATKNC